MIKKIWNTITALAVILVVVLMILLVGVRIAGINVYSVLSGSMEPAYRTGSVIYVREIDTEKLKVGDVITFRLDDNTIATHRIVEVTETAEEMSFRTKGDANEIEDASAVPASRIVGKVIFTIPYLGYLVTYIQSASGRYAAIAVGAALLLLIFLPDLIFGEDNTRIDKEKDKDKESKEKAK